jgi:hypothetical protein
MPVYVITSLLADAVDTGTEVANERVVTIDEYWLNLLISMILPIVVALVTKRFANGQVKAVVLLALSVITGWLTSLQATGGTFELKSAITSTVVSFVAAVAVHFGLLAPAGVTGADGVIARSVPGGIGGERRAP